MKCRKLGRNLKAGDMYGGCLIKSGMISNQEGLYRAVLDNGKVVDFSLSGSYEVEVPDLVVDVEPVNLNLIVDDPRVVQAMKLERKVEWKEYMKELDDADNG